MHNLLEVSADRLSCLTRLSLKVLILEHTWRIGDTLFKLLLFDPFLQRTDPASSMPKDMTFTGITVR